MRPARALVALAAVALLGCATAPVPTVSSIPRVVTEQPLQSPSPTVAPTPIRTAPATPTPTPAAPLKKFATVKLPTQIADRRADQVVQSAGGQTAAYYKPLDTADVIVAAVSPIGSGTEAASKLVSPRRSGAATCGNLTIAGKATAACVIPLDSGYVLVNASGAQTVDTVAAFTAALYASLP